MAHKITGKVRPTRPIHRFQALLIRAAGASDAAGEALASAWLADHPLPFDAEQTLLVGAPNDRRPLSYGIHRVADLHTQRQLAYLVAAHDWIDAAAMSDVVARAMRLAISTSVASNNRLCGYATDYGRLSPLFSVRAFALPWLRVELNPLNAGGGRGTLDAVCRRVAKSASDDVRRHAIDAVGQIVQWSWSGPRTKQSRTVEVANAVTSAPPGDEFATICVTDPPYFDFIAYDSLSQVFRPWLAHSALAGAPLLPGNEAPAETFGVGLGQALASAMQRCEPTAPLVFTYKGGRDAWEAVGRALDDAKLRVTALWPVLADPHMGVHANDGNCEFDLVVVARASSTCDTAEQPIRIPATWLRALRAHRPVTDADEANMRHACAMAASRWGTATFSA